MHSGGREISPTANAQREGSRMSYRLLFPVAVAVILAVHPPPLHGQAPNTVCNSSGNPLHCDTGPSVAPSRQDSASTRSPRPNSQLPALGAILAQRLADRPAARETWSRARGDNARIGVQDARANYNAMTAMMQRLVQDSAASSQPALNGDLNLEFSLLSGVEARYEEDRPESGRRREALTRMSVSPGAGGEEMFRLEEDGDIFINQQKVWTYRSRIQYEPAASLFYQTEERIPWFPESPPAYEAVVLVGDVAFSAPMPPKRRFEKKVAPGAVYPTMLGLVITAMSGELPPAFRIWIVNEQGEVVPADISVVRELTVQEPVGTAGGSCAGTTGTSEPRRAVELLVSAGTLTHSRIVLADAPHLKVSDDLKCRVVRGPAGQAFRDP